MVWRALVIVAGCTASAGSASPPLTQPPASQPASQRRAVETPKPATFASLYGERLTPGDSVHRQLSPYWPTGVYKVHRFTALTPGSFGLSYSFSRTRPGRAAERVTRVFPIHVLPRDAERHIVLDAPHHLPGRVGDVFEIPEPLSDPHGAFSDFSWNAPVDETPYAVDGERCAAGFEAGFDARYGPQLELVETICDDQPWHHYRVAQAGRIDGTYWVVAGQASRAAGSATVTPYVRRDNGAHIVDNATRIELAVGDHVWLRPQ